MPNVESQKQKETIIKERWEEKRLLPSIQT